MQSLHVDRRHVTVLHVHRHEATGKTRADLLARAGYQVLGAAGGRAALATLRARRPDVVLVEDGLGDAEALELCQRIKTDPDTDRTAVIRLAADASPAACARSLDRGADGSLPATVDPALLTATIDALVRARQAEAASRRAAEQAERRKDEFLAMLAHELRNPLASIVNALHVLRRAGAEGQAGRMRDIIHRQALHLARLVDDLLDVSRVQLGKISLARTPVDLNDVVRRSLESLHAAGKAAGHEVALVLAPRPAVVEGDAVRLEQVVGNLLDNAVKYSPSGATVRVEVATERPAAGRASLASGPDDNAPGEVLIRVVDRGVGIEPAELERIFHLFSQAERSLDRARGGLGLGLALARALVEMHGGRISASSPGLGQGSEFVVRLPLAPSAPDGRDGMDREAPMGGEAAHCRVLVVEDNQDAREALRAILELDGHAVTVAEDGPAGLAAARAGRPDVALVDIGLPGLDGYEVCRRLRAAPEGQDLCIIALTGYGQPDDHAATAAAGFDAHLVKPVEPAALERAIAAFASPR